MEDTLPTNDYAKEPLKILAGGADHVFVVIGSKGAIEKGVGYLSHGGNNVHVGPSKGELQFNHPEKYAKETNLLCSRSAAQQDFECDDEVLSKGFFPIASYVIHSIPIDQLIGELKTDKK